MNTNTEEEQKPNFEETPVTVEKSSEEKIAELNDKYLRLHADFDNYKKRSQKERIELIKFSGEEIFGKLLPIVDDFERAMKSASTTTDAESIKQGMQLIFNKFNTILTQNGLAEMKIEGKEFNADLHQAITNAPAPSDDLKGKVLEVVERGYFLNGKVIRHAKVIVGN